MRTLDQPRGSAPSPTSSTRSRSVLCPASLP